MSRWTTAYSADGLRDKFSVYKTAHAKVTGVTDIFDEFCPTGHFYAARDRVGADGEFVFVLRPETDKAAWEALNIYASAVRHSAPKLGDDINAHLRRIYLAEHDYGLEP